MLYRNYRSITKTTNILMANKTNSKSKALQKKTLKQIHAEITRPYISLAAQKRMDVLKAMGAKGIQTWYDLTAGRKKLTDLEKGVIAGIYGMMPEQINWLDEEKPIA